MNVNRRLIIALLLATVAPAALAATPPELVSYQGVLRSAAGSPLDGTYDMVFRFTATETGGTLLLTDYHTGPDAVVVSGGLFTAMLGGGTLAQGIESSLADVFANYSPVYVEVQVGAETLAPRVKVVSTAYALNARMLDGRTPGDFLDASTADQVKAGKLTSLGGLVAEPTATSGDVRAVNATTLSTAGVAVLGSALATSGATEGVRGQTTSPSGRGVVGGAFATSGATVGVYGESQSPDGSGVEGVATATSGGTVGVGGENFSTLGTGVAGVARATTGDAWGVYGETASPTGYGVVSIGDSITSGDIYATGTKYFITEHPTDFDSAIRFACIEGDETGVYHRGSGRLENGRARIEFPDPFPLVAAGEITVQITPEGESGSLYVPRSGISADGFTVREAGTGDSNVEFTYLAMAERRGYEDAEVLRPLSISDKIVTTTRLTPEQKSTLRAALPRASTQAVAEDKREALFEALHTGDFSDSCRLLGGCGGATPAPRRDPVADPRAVTATVSSPAPADVTERDIETTPAPPPSVLAVPHIVSDTVEAGDVVVVDRLDGALRRGRDAHDRGVVGVVAFAAAPVAPGETAPVAVAGVVDCRVDAGYGWIEPGDLLVVSPTPGHAMRVNEPAPGTVVGKALEPLESGQGTIKILLMPR